jgi:SAM-dependent methyltransferase
MDRPTTRYAFDNRSREASLQLATLQRFLDPHTADRLGGTVVRPGDRCWEVGAGGGSVARMLKRLVGPAGTVVATDIDPVQITPREGLVVRTHDVRHDPVPEQGPFQVIHARLVLLHLPERRRILRTLAGALAPGGTLLVEEFECTAGLRVLTAPSDSAAKLFTQVTDAMLGVLAARGADLGWALEVPGEMAAAGLSDVDTTVSAESWPGGSPGAVLHEVNSIQLAPRLLDAGLDPEQLSRFRQLMHDPRFSALSYTFVSTRGRRAA